MASPRRVLVSAHSLPRCRTLLAEATGGACPEVEFFGKPTLAPYRLAEQILDKQIDALGAMRCSTYNAVLVAQSSHVGIAVVIIAAFIIAAIARRSFTWEPMA